MSKTLHRKLEAKMAALKGPEWDSSDEDEEVPAPAPTTKKTSKKNATKTTKSKKKDKAIKFEEDATEGSASGSKKKKILDVVYLGHLPNELEERDLRTFLMQFGKVTNVRVSRSIKTGHPRGYAFVRFSDAETSAIVADTLQGYFLGKRRLISHLVPDPHPRLFYDTDTVIAKRAQMIEQSKRQRNRNLASTTKLKEITSRLVARERKKRAKLAAMGIDYDFPGYEAEANHVSDNDDGDENKTPKEEETVAKTPPRKDSVDSTGSSSKKSPSKRKDSVDSAGSASSSGKKSKKKRKDSVGSEASAEDKDVAPSSDKKKKKRKNSQDIDTPETPSKEEKEEEPAVAQTEKKKKKKKKDSKKKRRESAP